MYFFFFGIDESEGRKAGERKEGRIGWLGGNSRPFSMPRTAASPTALFTESIVSLTAEPESLCASGLVEKRSGVVIVARGARKAMVRRRDMVEVFFLVFGGGGVGSGKWEGCLLVVEGGREGGGFWSFTCKVNFHVRVWDWGDVVWG